MYDDGISHSGTGMNQTPTDNLDSSLGKKRFLIGQLGSFGDCLYATTVARQIKHDYPSCHLTWAVGSLYRSILEGNPYVDEIWEVPITSRNDLLDRWQKFEDEAINRKNKGDFDEIFLTQVFPNNLKNFDGTLRSSIFRAYHKPITVPVAPVLRLTPSEVENVRKFARLHCLEENRHVILFECSPKSGQSFVTLDFAVAVSKDIIRDNDDACVILSTNEPVSSPDKRIIDGSMLSFRENAELTKYCTLLIGCSSGISWLCTSEWAAPLPMVQLLKKGTYMYASFICDHEYQNLPTDTIIEMINSPAERVSRCVEDILTVNFGHARQQYHEQWRLNFQHYAGIVTPLLLQKGKTGDFVLSLKCTIKRYGFHIPIFLWCYFMLLYHLLKRFRFYYFNNTKK
jgi:hypothetical protein